MKTMGSVHIKTACSSSREVAVAVGEILASISGVDARVVFAFVPATGEMFASYHRTLRAGLAPTTRLVSVSTSDGITNAGYHLKRLVVGALHGDIDVGIGFGTNLEKDAPSLGSDLVEQAAEELGVSVPGLGRKHGMVLFDDGSKMKKEELLLGVLERNQGLVVVGGGAAAEEFGAAGWMGVDEHVFTDGAVGVLFATDVPWVALRHHAYEPVGHRVHVTKIDEINNRILEFDDQPAGKLWAELLGIPAEHLTLAHPREILKWGLAVKVGREYFMRSFMKDMASDELQSNHWLQEGQEFELMRLSEPVARARAFFEDTLPHRLHAPGAALLFDCGARKLFASMEGQLDALGDTFAAAPPSVGCVVNYETYCSFMISGTLTSLVFSGD